ncbi:MAG: voltage-gated potassium channel [Kosmotogales bacterium]|nr:voltage-gated potassium channel [Kosmotogales bacterium]
MKIKRNERRLFYLSLIIAGYFLFGTVGFMIIEEWSMLDSIFMTLITFTTVGYGLPNTLSRNGMLFTNFVLLFSGTVVVFAITSISNILLERNADRYILRKRALKEVKKLNNHVIIAGAGDLGKLVADQIIKLKYDVVQIDSDVNTIDTLKATRKKMKVEYVIGDASDEEVLKDAGIDRASTLISCLPDDKNNIFCILTARGLNKNIQIISKAKNAENISKIKYAGANRVIALDNISANRMVAMVQNPKLLGFLDNMDAFRDNFSIESVPLPDNFEAKPLESLKINEKYGLLVIGVLNETTHYFPKKDFVLKPGNGLIIIGRKEKIQEFRTDIDN